MEPEDLRFGGGASATLLHPLVAVALVVAIILILCLPRRRVILPLLLMIFLTPRGQVVVVGGLHFTIARILVVAALLRWVTSPRTSRLVSGLNSIDRLFAALAVSTLLTFSIQWMETQALVKSLGDFLDAMGGYFVMRSLIHDKEDITRAIKVLAAVAIITAPCMLSEQISHTNIFGLLGGVASVPAVRGEAIRSQGAFGVYITAGVFGASLLPLLLWLWKWGESKLVAGLGVISSTVMAITCHASTALLAYAAGILALCFWPLRRRMRAIRWGLVLTLTALHLLMKAPVWALIARIDLTGSSSGYQRFQLVDTCINHFWDWWLLGVKSYDSWGFDMWDLSNQYVAYAVTGGLLCLVLFVGVISRAFSALGAARKNTVGNREHEWFLWCLGAALLSHVFAYFGIGYFDQMQYAWYAFLAMVSAATAALPFKAVKPLLIEESMFDIDGDFAFSSPGVLGKTRCHSVVVSDGRD